MKVALYIRVSTKEQAREGLSLAAQEDLLRKYCKLYEYTVYGVYCDDGYSAKNTKRPALERLFTDIENHLFDAVIVWKLTRISRNTIDLLKMISFFEKNTWEEEDVPDYELSSNVTVTKDADSVTERTETSLINKSNPRLGSVSVSKMIPVESLDLRHGDLSFTFTITGETVHEKEYTDKQTVTFTKNTVSDEDNVITINGKKYLVLFVSFDDLDWGDYKITESGSESRYEFNKISDLENATAGKEEDGTPYIAFTVDKDHQEFGGTFENAAISSSIKVIKRGNSKTKKLKGVTFKIEKILADKKTELVATKETDENGEILFDNLDPGDYVLTETKTLPGYTLMKDPINVTVPMALTTKEAEDMKADTSKGKYDKAKDLYYFYDLTYDVDNEKTPTPPLTGGFENWLSYLPIVLAMALFI